MGYTDKETRFKEEYFELYSELNLASLLDKIADQICYYIDCRESAIFLYDEVREELFFEIATGEKKEELKKIVMKKGEGIVGWAADRDTAVIVNDCSKDPRFNAAADRKTHFITESILAVPVRREGKLLGVLEAVNKINGKFDEKDKQLLESIASFITIPLQNALLFKKITSETREKEQLIELGKIVSNSFGLDEVFQSLKKIITETVDPLEINMMVKSRNENFQLVSNTKGIYQDIDLNKTTIKSNQIIFPLRTENKILGYMEVKTRKKIPDELVNVLRGVALFAAISINKYEMHVHLMEERLIKEKMEKEMQIARSIQRKFLPENSIAIKGLDLAYINISSSAVGGDYFDIITLDDHETVFTINDVSGHGVPASLLMSIFSANFKYRIARDRDILATIRHLDNLIAETTDEGQFVTSFTCTLDTQTMKLSYINAGHHYPIIFRKRSIVELSEGETVLGIMADIPRAIETVQVEKNDLILLYTDGIIEAEDKKGTQYSRDRLLDFFFMRSQLNVEEIKEQLIRELKNYVQKDYFDDDVTFIILRIKGD